MMTLSLLAWLFASFAVLLPPPAPPHVASVEGGQAVFRRCAPCHPVKQGGGHTIGPNLFGIMDRPAGAVGGFSYSAAMKAKAASGLVWTDDNLRPYLADPRGFLPGGSMAFAGLRNPDMMDDLIAYLRTLK